MISTTSSARTIRRPLLGRIACAADGSTAASRRCSSPEPRSASSASSRARTSGSVPGNSSSSTAARTYSPEPPTRTGVRPCASSPSMTPRAIRWYSATLAATVTSQTSSRWWVIPPCSPGVSLAVPMSMPR